MLDSHPDIAIPLDTTGLWDRYERRLPTYGDLGEDSNRRRLIEDLLAEKRIQLWESDLPVQDLLERSRAGTYPEVIQAFYTSYAHQRGKPFWGDKDPGNMTRLDQLHRWFPKGRFIHIIRDGRDACLSQLEQDFGFDDLFECACAWREEVQWVRRLGAILGERYAELKYEDLVRHPAECLQALCEFLGLPYAPAMLHYHTRVDQAVPEEKRHLWPMLRRPPASENAARWTRVLRTGQRVAFEKRAGVVLADLGYETLNGISGGAYLEEVRHLLTRSWRATKRRFSHWIKPR